jgi:DNA-binding CsgD family transcriptional regulator
MDFDGSITAPSISRQLYYKTSETCAGMPLRRAARKTKQRGMTCQGNRLLVYLPPTERAHSLAWMIRAAAGRNCVESGALANALFRYTLPRRTGLSTAARGPCMQVGLGDDMRFQTAITEALSLEPSRRSLSPSHKECLFSALDTFKIGVAVFDRRLRYTAVSRTLAEFTRLPVEAHPGKPMDEVVDGSLVNDIAALLEHVFSTGQPLPNLQRSGRLLTRPGQLLHWLSYYFPLVDSRQRVVEVGIMGVELGSHSVSEVSCDPATPPAKQKDTHKSDHTLNPDSVNQSEVANSRQTAIALSDREQQVLRLLAEGKSNKEISPILAISVKTVETYRSRLMLKLRAPSLIQLVHYAIRHNLVDLQG